MCYSSCTHGIKAIMSRGTVFHSNFSALLSNLMPNHCLCNYSLKCNLSYCNHKTLWRVDHLWACWYTEVQEALSASSNLSSTNTVMQWPVYVLYKFCVADCCMCDEKDILMWTLNPECENYQQKGILIRLNYSAFHLLILMFHERYSWCHCVLVTGNILATHLSSFQHLHKNDSHFISLPIKFLYHS